MNVEETNKILSNKNSKDNKTFLLLSVFGILFVVFGHCNRINIFLNNVFPYYSFHMALFAFISGYFFKDRKINEFLKIKVKKLIVPFFIWNIIYGIIINILKYFRIIKYGENLTLYNIFISPLDGSGNQFYFNVAAWFVISIFFVQLIYIMIHKINRKLRINTEVPTLIVSIIIAYFELKLVQKGYSHGIWFLITRISFLIPFYLIGKIYKKVEKYDKMNSIMYFGIILLIQCVLLQKFNLVYNLNTLSFHHNYIVYLIGSITGIFFWLRVSKIITKYVATTNKIIDYIGNNTYEIMMHHVFIWFLINSIIGIINKYFSLFKNFNWNQYQTNVWYCYNNNPAYIFIYIILGIAMPILFKIIYMKLKVNVKNKFEKIKMYKLSKGY